MKIQDSSDSDDIDLDEIAKMIDPLDDLEKNLFSMKPPENTTRTSRISSPRKEILHGEKLEERGDDEAEVLTSFSSNNGQGKSEDLGKSWSKNLEGDSAVGSGGRFNAPARARRRNAKFTDGAEGIISSAVDGEFKGSSNVETGLWSGDDLWRLNGDKILDPPEASKASLMSGLKSPRSDSRGKTDSVSTKMKGDNKPGKFDWLGLLDDESEEEKDKVKSTGNKDKKISIGITSNADKDIAHSREKLDRLDANLQDHDHARKGSLGLSKEIKLHENISHDMDPKGKLSKSSLSENLSLKKGDLKSSESEHLELRKLESKGGARPEVTAQVEGKAAKMSEVLRTDENDHLDLMGLSNEGAGRLARGYAPTFSGSSPEDPGCRRRKREGAEGMPPRPAINSDFDPLGLFSVDDDSSKVEDTSKSKASLPDWLTGSSKKLSVVKENGTRVNLGETAAEAVKEVGGNEGVKEAERHKDAQSKRGSYSEKPKEDDSQLSKYSEKMVSETKEMGENIHDVLVSNDLIVKDATEKFHESRRKDEEPSSPYGPHGKGSEQESESASDETHNQSPTHVASVASRKGHAVSAEISGADKMSLKSKDKLSTRENKMKGDAKSSKKHVKTSSSKSKAKKRDLPRDDVSNEDVDLSSSERTDSKSGKEFLLLERRYGRKVRELEEHVGRAEQLEEELLKMRYLEGEVEHLKAVVHVLELEKSAAEALVESLQARHSEQLKRLEDVHRNEVETLRKALLREEKRGAEEVKRLVEDHRKTLDRLMDANTRLEEEFRARMLEARRDWNRDVEAMRVAYQQSNSAAITNASLAVLTGQSFGADTKDKTEDDIKDESLSKAASQCPPEVKELSQTVERVESILSQALEVMLPKGKSLAEEVPVLENEAKVKGHDHVVNSFRKHQGMSLRAKRKQRHAKAQSLSKKTKDKADKRKKPHDQSGSSEEEEDHADDHSVSTSISDGEDKFERILQSDTDNRVRRHVLSKDVAEQRKEVYCGECKCCRGHIKGLRQHLGRSISVQDSRVNWNKSDKEGHNVKFRSGDGEEHWKSRKKMFAWKDQMGHENIYRWNKEDRHVQNPGQGHFTMNEGIVLDGNFTSMPRQSNAIIDPKAYLLQLASANINNLFQTSLMTSA